MKAIVIKPENVSDTKFLTELLKKLGIPSIKMDMEEIEDMGLLVLMKQADRNQKVSKAEIMKKLNS